MFAAKNNLPKYEYILFRDSVNNKTLAHVTETDADKLNEMILRALGENDLKSAELYAKKLAIYHGVPGLIHYYHVMLKAIKSDIAEDETVDQEACNVLAYLYLAKEIYESDASIAVDVRRLMPEEDITDKNYWANKVAEMKSLLDISGFNQHAIVIGHGMFTYKESRGDKSQAGVGRK